MARGPKPQPAAIKLMKGNPGRRRVVDPTVQAGEAAGKAAPIGKSSELQAPKNLTDAQRAVWDTFVPDLEAMRLMRSTDTAAFARYCVWTVKWNEAERALRRAKLVTVTESDHVTMERMSKWLMVMIHIDKRLGDIEERFGMNPSARQRIFAQLASLQPSLPLAAAGELDQPASKPAPAPTAPVSASPVGLLN
ncbi:MAG: P27 family phage terminase small subunit [Alphaproteobacteria bacterium]|nr:P27 family phage terminase small subunit [Alphaproteobacteria bacterium]